MIQIDLLVSTGRDVRPGITRIARPARGTGCVFFWSRVRDAWAVLTGHADAVTFAEDMGDEYQ